MSEDGQPPAKDLPTGTKTASKDSEFQKTNMTKNKILLEEAKAGYTRQLSNWDKLDHRFQNFLQLNVFLLTIVFIGIGFIGMNSTDELIIYQSLQILFYSAIAIVVSIIISVSSVHDVPAIKKIDKKLDYSNDTINKEGNVISFLIVNYNAAREKIIKKYDKRMKCYHIALTFFFFGLFFILFFISILFLSQHFKIFSYLFN